MAEFLGLSEEELQLFLDETVEHLDTLETELLQLERGGADDDQVARIFRAAHTIKGAAATVGLEGMARLTHAMETLFDLMRMGQLVPSQGVVTTLLSAVDVLRQMLAAVTAGEMPADAPADLLAALEQAGEGQGDGPSEFAGAVAAAATQAEPDSESSDETVRTTITVQARVSSDCPMPAVRALQVLLALEGFGQVVKSDPTETDIEAEKVGRELSFWVDTQADAAAIREALSRVPDITEVEVIGATAPAPGVEPAPTAGSSGAAAAGPAAAAAPGRAAQAPPGAGVGEDRTIRVDVALLDDLMNLVGELVIDRGRLVGIGQTLERHDGVEEIAEELGRLTGHLARVTGTLQETVLKARMLPIERIFKKFPRMVRDLAQHMGKQVNFRMSGEDTELDRSVLEVIGDPLMHLVRNALDHGLESTEDRVRVGKSATATLELIATHEENHVVIIVQDDGRGIDPERVQAAAIKKGLISAERARELGEQEAIQLLFASGFSTADQVTDVSGRGVGLDVVRKNIERVGGRIEVESKIGVGTTFRLLLPLTLATIRALLIEVGRDILALPLSTIAETLRVPPEEITSVKGRWVTQVRGRVVPLLWLQQFMEPGFRPERGTEPVLAVLVTHKGELIGLVVDRLVGEQEVVVKGLGQFFGQVRGVSGSTILGDGNLALIVDVGGLIGVLSAENGGVATGVGQAEAKVAAMV